MSNLVKDVTSFDTKVYKVSGPLGKNLLLTKGQGKIEIGQVLSYDEATGKVVKYVADPGEGKTRVAAFTIALSEADATSKDVPVLVAVPNTVFNSEEVKGAVLTTDFKIIKELWQSGIILEEVK